MSRDGAARSLSEQLSLRIDALARQLLPAGYYGPGRRHWRCGSLLGEQGQSLCVWLDGARRGRWKDYASGDRGDSLDLVAQVMCRGDISEAIKWAADWLGLGDLNPEERQHLREKAEAAQQRHQAEADKENYKHQMAAKKVFLAAEQLRPGDAAWGYLLGRAIDLSRLPSVPRAIRCHAALYNPESHRPWPALVAAIADHQGKHVNTHRIWLEQHDDGSVTKAPLERPKLSMLGGYAGGCVRLWRGSSNLPWNTMAPGETLLAGEGLEDTLSGMLLKPQWRASATLSVSGLEALVLPAEVKRLIWIAQNDPKGSPASRALHAAFHAHRTKGRVVASLRPPVFCKDLNDYLQWLDKSPGELTEEEVA
jgi:hypothetical protein